MQQKYSSVILIHGGGKIITEWAEKMGINLLGQIPIVQGIRESGDSGKPVALDEDHQAGEAFMLLSREVQKALIKRNADLEPTRKVDITTK